MKKYIFVLSLLLGTFSAYGSKPPKGFVSIFNGKDLTGWWGLKTEDPAKWMALSPQELKKKKEASLKDIKQHWKVQDGILINDGKGLYLSTEKNYGDFELMVDYKTVPGADSGIYLRAFLKSRFGIPRKKPENGNLEPTKDRAVYGTTERPEHRGEIHWFTQTSLSVNGIPFTLP